MLSFHGDTQCVDHSLEIHIHITRPCTMHTCIFFIRISFEILCTWQWISACLYILLLVKLKFYPIVSHWKLNYKPHHVHYFGMHMYGTRHWEMKQNVERTRRVFTHWVMDIRDDLETQMWIMHNLCATHCRFEVSNTSIAHLASHEIVICRYFTLAMCIVNVWAILCVYYMRLCTMKVLKHICKYYIFELQKVTHKCF
jgi:hypothetical protein